MTAERRLQFEAIGTPWSIDIYEPVSDADWTALKQAIANRIEAFDHHYSRFRPDSLITRMAEQAGTYELPTNAEPLFDLYRQLYGLTNGTVTPLIGQTLSDAGYDAAYSLKPGNPTPPPAWDEVLEYNHPRLTLKTPALLDVGAAGKGYLVDLVSELLEGAGVSAYCVDAGGDLRYRHPSGQSLRVGLEHPADPSKAIGVAELQNASLCGSAPNRRAWAGYHHVLNPRTLDSPRHLAAVWVAAGSTLLADALTTALFFVDAERLAGYYEFEYAIVQADGSLSYSAAFPATFFTSM
jgi:thiamine biosynthesis lipoprotein